MRSTMQKPAGSMHSMSIAFYLFIGHLSKSYYTNIQLQLHSNDDMIKISEASQQVAVTKK